METGNDQADWYERNWQIGSLSLHAPAKGAGFIDHGTYADSTPLRSPVHVVLGGKSGPILYVQAGVHGDELNGIEVLRRIVTELVPEQLSGGLIVVPVTNGPGFVAHRRRNWLDKEDMNRVWPGKVSGALSTRMAYNIYQQAIRHAHAVIDLHTDTSRTLLHVLYGRGDEASRKLAEVFGLGVLLEEEITEDLKQARFTGKLRNVLTGQGIAAITPELGGTNCFEEEYIRPGVRGVKNVMKYLGMLEGEVIGPKQPQITLRGSHLDKIWASQGGIWVSQVKPGDKVKTEQLLGSIYAISTFEIVESLYAPYDGFVLGLPDVPVVNMGDTLLNLCRLDS